MPFLQSGALVQGRVLMIHHFGVALLVTMLFCGSIALEGARSDVSDLPNLEGFSAVDKGSDLNAASSRRLEVLFTGTKPADEALATYTKALEGQEWSLQKDIIDSETDVRILIFHRLGQRLTLSVSAETDVITVLRVVVTSEK
jgi:hypothetical protein